MVIQNKKIKWKVNKVEINGVKKKINKVSIKIIKIHNNMVNSLKRINRIVHGVIEWITKKKKLKIIGKIITNLNSKLKLSLGIIILNNLIKNNNKNKHKLSNMNNNKKIIGKRIMIINNKVSNKIKDGIINLKKIKINKVTVKK